MRAGSKTLVTGASGILGKAIMKRMAGRSWPIGVSRRGLSGHLAADLSDEAAVRKIFKQKFNAVIHSAAYSDVDGCERDPQQAWESNALSTRHLAQAAAESGAAFIYVSTDYVFSGEKTTPYKEEDEPCPVNIYGMSKLGGECYALASPGPAAVVRTSWLFGDGNPANFVTAILERLKTQPTVDVLDDQVDSPTYVVDLAAAIETILDKLVEGEKLERIYQFCNKGQTTRYGMTLKMAEILKLPVKVGKTRPDQIPIRLAARPMYGVMSTERYEKLSQRPVRSWEACLKEYLEGKEECLF